MPVTEFDFATLKEYITSSEDEVLREIAVKEKKKYVGSSSSMTSVLSHFHFLLSAWRPVDVGALSSGFPDKMRNFTRLLRSPAAMFLRYKDGVYAIDADKEFDNATILSHLGKSMEKLLTLPKHEFERYRRSSDNKISAEEEQATPESYHYSTAGDFIMRSQLDAHDPRLPGSGMFDLKTRAVVSVRMDAKNFERGLGYEIKGRFGAYESFEREYFDMIRAAFLKYSLQVRIGRMDGIFVAMHNIERIFGFQYVSLPEMDQALHGQSDTSLGDSEFNLSLALWNKVLDKATSKFPKQSLRFHFEMRDTMNPFMYIFAEPVNEEEIHAIQTKNKAEMQAYQRRILNLDQEDYADTESPPPTSLDPSVQLPEADQSKPSTELDSSPSSMYDSQPPPQASSDPSIQLLEDDQSKPSTESDFSDIESPPLASSDPSIQLPEAEFKPSIESESSDTESPAPAFSDFSIHVQLPEADQSKPSIELDSSSASPDPSDPSIQLSEADQSKPSPGSNSLEAESPVPAPSDPSNQLPKTESDPFTESDSPSASMYDSSLPPDEFFTEENGKQDQGDEPELLAMTLQVKNKVNGIPVDRPSNFTSKDEWTVDYELTELDSNYGHTCYMMCQARRQKSLQAGGEDSGDVASNVYLRRLRELAKAGRKHRKKENELDREKGVVVLTDPVERRRRSVKVQDRVEEQNDTVEGEHDTLRSGVIRYYHSASTG